MLPDTISEDVDANTVYTVGDVPEAEAIPVRRVPAFEEGTPKFTRYNQYESLILPMQKYLEAAGVDFQFNTEAVSYTHLKERNQNIVLNTFPEWNW